VTISTFGIGEDFDEELMKGISESGLGDYFFIDSGKNIPGFVSKAIHGLMSIIGTNSCLKVRGKNGVIVKKYLTANKVDMLEGYCFGDLNSGNLKQIIVEIEVSPTKEEKTIGVTYELSFIEDSEKKSN